MRKGTGGAPESGNSLGFNLTLLRGQEFAAHFRKRGAQLVDFAGSFGNDGKSIVSSGKRANTSDEIVERFRDRARDKSEKKGAKNNRGSAEDINRSGEVLHKRIAGRQRHHHVTPNR